MRSGAISGACRPSAAIAATAAIGSGASDCVRCPTPKRRSSTSMILRIKAGGVTSGRNSSSSTVPSRTASMTPSGRPVPASARSRCGKASAHRGSIARAIMAASYQRAPGTGSATSLGSTFAGPSTKAYARGTLAFFVVPNRTRTPSRSSARRRSCNAESAAVSTRTVRAQSTMDPSLGT